jgi:metallo-beta-lactamase class B
VSDEGFRFTGDAKRPSLVDTFQRSISRVEELPCNIILAPHPEFIGLPDKLRRLKERPEVNPFIEADACRSFAASARKRLEQRVASEKR